MHGLTVYVKEELPFACSLCCNSEDSYLSFWQVFLFLLSYFLYPCQSLSSSFCTVFDAISSKNNLDKVLSISLSSKVFIFGELMLITRTG